MQISFEQISFEQIVSTMSNILKYSFVSYILDLVEYQFFT